MPVNDYDEKDELTDEPEKPVTQPRWKSPVVWTTCAALLFFVVKTYFDYEIPQFDALVTLLIAAGVALGILNNPTQKGRF